MNDFELTGPNLYLLMFNKRLYFTDSYGIHAFWLKYVLFIYVLDLEGNGMRGTYCA